MNPPIDDILNLFPAWFYLSPTYLDQSGTLEQPDQCHTENLSELMLEDRNSNAAFPFIPRPTFSTSPIPPIPTPLFDDILNYGNQQESLFSPSSSLSSSSSPSSSSSTYQNLSSGKRNTRIGFCEHPKHVLYRQSHSTIASNNKFIENQPYRNHNHQHSHHGKQCHKHICKKLCRHHHFLHHLDQQKEPLNDTTPAVTTPRRGRPPKGTKSFERSSNNLTSSINNFCSHSLEKDNGHSNINYNIAMTTRPLPKRLESVVGKSNIYVCLTCLKRSDIDTDYLMNPAYIGPQSFKKRKNHLSHLT